MCVLGGGRVAVVVCVWCGVACVACVQTSTHLVWENERERERELEVISSDRAHIHTDIHH